VKDRNLVLAPITVMVVSDGIPDVRGGMIKSGTPASYQQIDLSPSITSRRTSPSAWSTRARRSATTGESW